MRALFAEELGAVVQIRKEQLGQVMEQVRQFELGAVTHVIGKPNPHQAIEIYRDAAQIFAASNQSLHQRWSETSQKIASLRDNPACVAAEYATRSDPADPGMTGAPAVRSGTRYRSRL